MIDRFTRNLLLLFAFLISCDEERSNDIFIAEYPENKKIAVSFTFDDGCPSVFTKIVPLFDRYNYKATFFIIPAAVKEEEWKKWQELIAKGYEIGNHSMTHRDLTKLDSSNLFSEILSSHQLMEIKLNSPILSFAHPFHQTRADIDKLVLSKHLFSRLEPGLCKWYGWTSLTKKEFFLSDIKKAFKRHDWFVPAMHGIGDCWEPVNETLLIDALEYIKNRQDEIVVETFAHIGLYKVERKYTMVDVVDHGNKKTISLKSNLDTRIYNYPLTLVLNNYYSFNEPKINVLSGQIKEVIKQNGYWMIIAMPNSIFEIL